MDQKMKIEAPIDFAELTTALEGLKDEDATETESETIPKEDKEKIEKIANPQAKKDGNKYLVSFELDWDEVVLYAIYSYSEDNSFISADFMQLRLSYSRYLELASKISDRCRLFFKSNMFM
jgi:hypothetical protein